MTTINGRACVVNGMPVDRVFSDGKQVYGRNLVIGSTDNVVHYAPVVGFTVWQSYVTKFNIGDILNISADISTNITATHGDTVLKMFLFSSEKIQIGYLEYRVSEGKTAHAFISKTIPTGTASILVKIDNANANFTGGIVPDVCAIRHQFANTGSVVANWSPAPEDVLK